MEIKFLDKIIRLFKKKDNIDKDYEKIIEIYEKCKSKKIYKTKRP